MIEKLNTLLVYRLADVEDFVNFLRSRGQGRALVRAAGALGAPAFAAVWNNPDDNIYHAL